MHPFSRYCSIIDQWGSFIQSLATPLPRTLWLNPLKRLKNETRDTLTSQWQTATCWPEAFMTEAPLTEASEWGNHWAYHAGLYHLQEIVSMLPVALLNPQSQDRVLDLCAAPGSKTVQIALAMKNQGTLIANDKNYNRTKALRYHLERLGIVNVTTTTFDGASYPNAAGLFNKILVDAPCSGEGTSRKKAKEWISGANVHQVHILQERLLARAINLCQPGGLIVYSTCTYAPEENEAVIDATLKRFPTISLLPISLSPIKTTPGITEWNHLSFSQELKKTVRIWPHHNNTGGFYLALLQKNPSDKDNNEPIKNTPLLSEPGIYEELIRLLQSFSIPESELKKYHYYHVPKHGIYVVSANHYFNGIPKSDATGLFVLKTHMQHPKLTTAGARLWGHLAQKQFIELNESEIKDYLQRKEMIFSKDQLTHCAHSGYVIIRHQGLALGTGLLLHTEKENEWVLKSLYPKT